jgi:hypothetical protein
MLSQSRREFLKSLTLAGVAVFTSSHLKAIDLDLTSPKDPKVVVGPYQKSWKTIYARSTEPDGYLLSLSEPDDDFDGMTWREIFEANSDYDIIKILERLDKLGLDGDAGNLEHVACEDETWLKRFAKKGGTAADPSDGPTWQEVFETVEPRFLDDIEEVSQQGIRYLRELDEVCDDWYDRVGPFGTPEGEAYLEVTELLDTIEATDSELGDAARECFEIIEGSSPGNDFHGVLVKTREDLGVLRRLLHASGEEVNIIVC